MLEIKENFLNNYHFLTPRELLKIIEIENEVKKYDSEKAKVIANIKAKKKFGGKIFEEEV
jgi:hypothetical protein